MLMALTFVSSKENEMRRTSVFCVLVLLLFQHVGGMAEENNHDQNDETEWSYEGWPNFCCHHLTTDPQRCSSWVIVGEGKEKRYQLEEDGEYFLYPDAYVDPQLIEQVKGHLHLIPNVPGDHCNYAQCGVCGQSVLRSMRILIEEVSKEDGYPFYGELIYPRCFYTCACLDDFVDLKNLTEEHKTIVSNWVFCRKPTILYPYFEKHLSSKFSNFKNALEYFSENTGCQCYWLECSNLATEINDEIYEVANDFFNKVFFWNYSLEGLDSEDEKKLWKEEQYPFRKLEECIISDMFFSDFIQDILNFDYSVFCKTVIHGQKIIDLEDIKEESVRFVHELVDRIKPLFLELYQTCYNKHPHQKIASEIDFINFELPKILPENIPKEDNYEVFQEDFTISSPKTILKRFGKTTSLRVQK